MRKRIALIAAVAVTVLGLVGGSVAYASLNKTVTLSIDGKAKEVQTFGKTVGDVLDDEGITVGDHDAVAPSTTTPIDEGSKISVRYGRELSLTVDGEESTYWVTATNVDAALSQIGRRFSGAELSASRGMTIGRSGLDLTVKTAKDIQLVVAGKKKKATTTAITVKEALADLKVKVDGDDEVKPKLKSDLDDGDKITVVKIDRKKDQRKVAIPNKTVVRYSSSMYDGQEKVTESGRDGQKVITYNVVLANGKERSRKAVNTKVVSKPVTRVEVHGTKDRPAPATSSSSSSSSSSSGGSSTPPPNYASGGTVWDRLAQCESGGNWAINTGNGYYGGLQFSLSTWRAYGGSGYPHQASRSTQISIAQRVLAAQGWGAWPACSARLGLR